LQAGRLGYKGEQWRTQKTFMGGGSFRGIWWSFVFGVRFLWRYRLMSYSCFQAKFVDIKGIFFYTHSPYFCKNQALYIPYNKVIFFDIKLKGGLTPTPTPLRTPLKANQRLNDHDVVIISATDYRGTIHWTVTLGVQVSPHVATRVATPSEFLKDLVIFEVI